MKEALIKFRCTEKEKSLIKSKARKAGLNLSEYCRTVALNKKLYRRLTVREVEQYERLAHVSNNFKIISNMFRKRDPRLSYEVNQLAERLREQLENFRP